MSQRYFGRPLAAGDHGDLRAAAFVLLATIAGVLVGSMIGDETLLTTAVAGALAAPAVTALLFGAHDGWKLLRLLRRAEAAGSVAPPPGDPLRQRSSARDVLGLSLLLGAGCAVASAVGGAAFCLLVAAGLIGKLVGPLLGGWFVRRLERRGGRRYYRTVGEPEKVVWLGASDLE